ncbi:TPA: hypothetical protein TU171_000109 [Streptococcus equi subsp. zooepidemicus]|uniref:hypothetical protein n=1 Tax=Streptococcus equi TaxID=1336 RepID=UPI001E4BCA24|nr:hypothetical protein [Streptococcus equi]MCD3374142.1 hypothetical protein [Streptococcus equi subsp. zooepidemicus]MDI5951583.1 hypothetical protein [Streptococcus equi subsp. zooepidemicus]MDI6073594.1 hypothetical protein [Streptococcus equi subsp. zooepidemicus]HEL0046692.1 hypothetical protein [Streptococcus equi subsp. zooepidemicus]HEL0131526.1 hypothetical protein [Streptococcus equi subsp. zooepidemicus]
MKRKTYYIVAALIFFASLLFSYRNRLYYSLKGDYYLEPKSKIRLKVRPKVTQIEYSSDLYLESDEKVLLKLEGRDIWSEYIYRQRDSYLSKIGYRYSIAEQVIEKYDSTKDNGVVIVEAGHKGATIDGDGLIVPLKGKRKYSVTEDHDYTITLTNLSDKPVAFYARVSDR